MASSIALVVIVAAGQAHDPSTTSLVDATRVTAGVQVIVEESASTTDEDALAFAVRDHADAVAVIVWEPDHSRANVHLHREGDPRWLDRAVGFQAADAPTERGRTIGFAIASMLPEPVSPALADPQAPPIKAITPPVDGVRAPDNRRNWRGAVDGSGLGALALGGAGSGGGFAIAGHLGLVSRVSLRAGLGFCFGQVRAAAATSFTFVGALGLAWRWVEPTDNQRFGFGGSASLMIMQQSLSRPSATDATATITQGRWVFPGGQLLLEGSVDLWSSVALLLTTGVEAVASATDVWVGGRPVSTLSPWRWVGETGVRVRF